VSKQPQTGVVPSRPVVLEGEHRVVFDFPCVPSGSMAYTAVSVWACNMWVLRIIPFLDKRGRFQWVYETD
jgi:hypothetical protein